MDSLAFVRLAEYRDELLSQRTAWADRAEFEIAQRLRIEAISIIHDACVDWAFVSWRSKEQAAGRRYQCDASARSAYAHARILH